MLRQATRHTFCLSMIMTTIITIFISLILHHAPSVFPGQAAVSERGSAQLELIYMLTYSCPWGWKEKKKKNVTNNWSTTKDARTCSLRSQIFFTVKMANRQESKTRITQLHNHIFIYLNKRCTHRWCESFLLSKYGDFLMKRKVGNIWTLTSC